MLELFSYSGLYLKSTLTDDSDLDLGVTADKDNGGQQSVPSQTSGFSDVHLKGALDQDIHGPHTVLPQTCEETGDTEEQKTISNALSLIATAYMD